jgi:hypothetical protein
MKSSKFILPTVIVLTMLFTAFSLFWMVEKAQGQITINQPTSDNLFVNYTFFATSTTDTQLATTTTATSTNQTAYNDENGVIDSGKIDLRGAEKVTFYFSRSSFGGNTGASKFFVEVSPDCSVWYPYYKLVGTDSASTATTTVTISAATTTVAYSMNLEDDAYQCARVAVQEFTDGKHGAAATIQY